MVELCKSADIGVGAAIADNNQEEKGYWADLVNMIKINVTPRSKKRKTAINPGFPWRSNQLRYWHLLPA